MENVLLTLAGAEKNNTSFHNGAEVGLSLKAYVAGARRNIQNVIVYPSAGAKTASGAIVYVIDSAGIDEEMVV